MAYPESWSHQYQDVSLWFYPDEHSREGDLSKITSGHLILRADWVFPSHSIENLWQQHVGAMAGMIGAKNVGSAPLTIRDASGYEAEIILPKKENKRLWLGILKQGPIVLNLAVAHHLKERDWFEPEVSKIIASLRFLSKVDNIHTNEWGFPLPDGYEPVDPTLIIDDISDPQHWQAYRGTTSAGALQAFYMREAMNYSLNITGYTPFPSEEMHVGFGRFQLSLGERKITLGIMPYGEQTVTQQSPANLVIKSG